jgi:hypothetical protein
LPEDFKLNKVSGLGRDSGIEGRPFLLWAPFNLLAEVVKELSGPLAERSAKDLVRWRLSHCRSEGAYDGDQHLRLDLQLLEHRNIGVDQVR